MKWSEQTWKKTESLYQSILALPFITELSSGILAKEKYRFYMAQDSLYLEHFGEALSLIAVRNNDKQYVLDFIRFVENAFVAEHALHESFLKDFEVTNKGILEPVGHHYVHYLKSTVALEPIEVAMAAILPCFWLYEKIGKHLFENQKSDNNPYQKWIDTYSENEFTLAAQQVISFCDKAAKNTSSDIRKRMTNAFIVSCKMEYLFWQAAYSLKKWEGG